jgi:hypothetical protein
MERLNTLRMQYEETKKILAFPVSIEEFRCLCHYRNKICGEAQMLAQSLNIQGRFWFNTAE